MNGKDTLSDILTCLAKCNPGVAEMLLELCVTELEDVAADRNTGRSLAQPVVQESPHPYTDDTSLAGHVKIPGTVHSLYNTPLYLSRTGSYYDSHFFLPWNFTKELFVKL